MAMDKADGAQDAFLHEMDAELVGWENPAERLRIALARDEFVLYCQPILALQAEDPFPMAEVLVRLRAEEKGMLPPGDFLPAFEHYRMMPQLDRWVVRHTLARLARGSRVPAFTVNVSGQTLEDEEFPLYVAREAMAAGVPARLLVFEIDEHDVIARLPAAERFTAAMRALGAGTLVDGFGYRLVSFAPLKSLRVNYVKIDGRITRSLLTNPQSETKTRAVLRVGQAIGVEVIAECVEENDVALRLKALGCNYAQGFGVFQAHPMDTLATEGTAGRR